MMPLNAIEAAFGYARRGWPVLPLHWPIEHGPFGCTCHKRGCRQPGKHPLGKLVPHGLKDATTDRNVIWTWSKRAPRANVAIITGSISGLFTVDLDRRHDGDETLNRLERKHGTLPRTLTAGSGGGGLHFYFRHERGIRSRSGALGPGLDIKGDGGFIVAPPSLHASGRHYTWLDEVEVAPAPAWLLDILLAEPERAPPSPNGRIPDRRQLEGLARFVSSSRDGGRHNAAFWGGAKAGEMVRTGLISVDAAAEVIARAAIAAGLEEADAYRTARDGVRAGLSGGSAYRVR